MLLAQSLGLNSCWVGGTYKVVNRAYNVDLGQKLAAVVALGYGASQGVPQSLTGYAGGINRKLWLLEHEGVDCSGLRPVESRSRSAPGKARR